MARHHSYTNYIKASDSLFSYKKTDLQSVNPKILPDYPDDIYDYQYLNRVLAIGPKIPDLEDWNRDLSNALKLLGPKYQANVILVFTTYSLETHSNEILTKWKGGNKNDIIVFLHTPNYPQIDAVKVVSLSYDDIFNVKLRDDLLALGKSSRQDVIEIVSKDVEANFKRRHMKDFEYLADDIPISPWIIFFSILFGIVSTGITTKIVLDGDY